MAPDRINSVLKKLKIFQKKKKTNQKLPWQEMEILPLELEGSDPIVCKRYLQLWQLLECGALLCNNQSSLCVVHAGKEPPKINKPCNMYYCAFYGYFCWYLFLTLCNKICEGFSTEKYLHYERYKFDTQQKRGHSLGWKKRDKCPNDKRRQNSTNLI